jgi:flavin-dependent dehydrogenase
VVGVRAGSDVWRAPLTILAAGAQGAAAKMLGCERDPDEPFGLAIRAYAETPRHAERHLEACLSLSDERGIAVPGYGWMFPAGDGTVNIGVGALSTMKGFKKLNLNHLLDQYAALVRLCRALRERYPVVDIAGHEHIAPGRKQDPGPGFDWAFLQQQLAWPDRCFPECVLSPRQG